MLQGRLSIAALIKAIPWNFLFYCGSQGIGKQYPFASGTHSGMKLLHLYFEYQFLESSIQAFVSRRYARKNPRNDAFIRFIVGILLFRFALTQDDRRNRRLQVCQMLELAPENRISCPPSSFLKAERFDNLASVEGRSN
jgi:hypothetical protein